MICIFCCQRQGFDGPRASLWAIITCKSLKSALCYHSSHSNNMKVNNIIYPVTITHVYWSITSFSLPTMPPSYLHLKVKIPTKAI